MKNKEKNIYPKNVISMIATINEFLQETYTIKRLIHGTTDLIQEILAMKIINDYKFDLASYLLHHATAKYKIFNGEGEDKVENEDEKEEY